VGAEFAVLPVPDFAQVGVTEPETFSLAANIVVSSPVAAGRQIRSSMAI
jgi:hypothetical protein